MGGGPLAAAMNRACECFPVSRAKLVAALKHDPLREEHANLVSGSAVFVSGTDVQSIASFIKAAGQVMALPAFRTAALAQAGATAQRDPGIAGGMLGFDFHLTVEGPRLIEINTNPGGILVNAEIQDALQACCEAAERWLPPLPSTQQTRNRTFAIFEREWREGGGIGAPTIAIVDESPATQYLSPEFHLFQSLFEEHGWRALITDPIQFQHRDGKLWLGDLIVDFVYNRLTDFSLEQTSSATLRSAYLAGDVVLSPHPRAHALNADKRLLGWLSDASRLRELGADAELVAIVPSHVPPTYEVKANEAERWWAQRKQFFFKPSAGYGGKATYAGDKLTRKTFDTILAGGYLAQQIVPPSLRGSSPDRMLKYDIRAFVDPKDYEVILLAARLYRGQTTNFRTAGGGFAPVVVVRPDDTAPVRSAPALQAAAAPGTATPQ